MCKFDIHIYSFSIMLIFIGFFTMILQPLIKKSITVYKRKIQ